MPATYSEATTLCACGCGKPTGIAKGGPRKGQRAKFIHGHHAQRHPHGWAEEDRGYLTPCRIWLGSKDSRGYGTKRDPATRRVRATHVMAWEEAHGPVPDGLELDHLCCQHACGNVEHLEAVTHRENMTRHWQRRGSSSRYPGVSWRKREKKWYAYVYADGRMMSLGFYCDEDEAGRVAAEARARL